MQDVDEALILRCSKCSTAVQPDSNQAQCAICGALLELVAPPPRVRGHALRRIFAERHGTRGGRDTSGVWRYRELLAVRGDDAITFPEGNTPLIHAGRAAHWAGCPTLRVKHEGLNPTGSFKDRGMTVGITQAKRVGARAVACASTGNTAASMAAYAARAGIPALVFIPLGKVAMGKLAQALAYGARTIVVRGDFDACLTLAREASRELGIYLLNSVNPYRLEGQKTIVFEMLEQCGWDAPDWIALPAGNLGNTAAFGMALAAARDLGLIRHVPRLLAVQAEGAAPFAHAFDDGFASLHRVTPNTVATAINIGDPASYDRAVRSIRETNGIVTTVSDDELLEAKAAVDAAGIGCEPASAAAVAGVRRMIRERVIEDDADVVSVLTGHLLKDPEATVRYHGQSLPGHASSNPPVEIDSTIDDLKRTLDRT
ncbi:MAG TPA: threonine synthase [Gemmatimonadaceae bacterium]|nr:threonine synthase [Gemmatimonadaceae bacterium]